MGQQTISFSTLEVICARSKAISLIHCLVLVSSTALKSTATEEYTRKLSSSYKNQQKFPQLNLWNTKRVKSMRSVSKRCVGTSGELKLVSKWSVDRVALIWSMTGVLNTVIYRFYTPMSDRSHLSFSPTKCPGKTKFYTWSKWEQEQTGNKT